MCSRKAVVIATAVMEVELVALAAVVRGAGAVLAVAAVAATMAAIGVVVVVVATRAAVAMTEEVMFTIHHM